MENVLYTKIIQKTMNKYLLTIIVVIIGAVSVFAISPYFIESTVDEACQLVLWFSHRWKIRICYNGGRNCYNILGRAILWGGGGG